MNRNIVMRLVLVVIAIAVLVVVGVAAYTWGLSNGQGQHSVVPIRGFRGPTHGVLGMGYGMGYVGRGGFWGLDLLGWLGLFLIGVLVILLMVGLVSRRGAGTSAGGGGVDRLRELSDMHARGELKDDEFEAAKRKLLGL
jgi:uncharacterized membrane protein